MKLYMDDENKLPDFSPDQDGVFRGESANEILSFLLQETDNGDTYELIRDDKLRVKGYYLDTTTGLWVAFDNSTFSCYVEEFANESIAFDWLCGNFSVSD